MGFEVAKTIFRNRNFPTILTFVLAIIAFSLSLVALLSTGEQGALKGYDILMASPLFPHIRGLT